MNKLNKKGFTLVELLAVIALIAVVLGLSTYGIIDAYNKSKKQALVLNEKSILEAARLYSTEANSDEWRSSNDKEYFCTTIQRLKNAGLLKKEAQSAEHDDSTIITVERDITSLAVEDTKFLGDTDRELTDLCGIKFYTIHYDYNAGEEKGIVPKDQKGEVSIATTLSSVKPTRKGFNFKEWNTASDGTGEGYELGASFFRDVEATIILYAQWEPNNYTIEYNLGNNSSTKGATPLGTTTCVPSDKKCSLKTWKELNGEVPFSDKGWKFAGWATNEEKAEAEYSDGFSKAFSDKKDVTIKLYAIFKRTVKFYSGKNKEQVDTATEYYNPYCLDSENCKDYYTSVSVPTAKTISSWSNIGYTTVSTIAASKEELNGLGKSVYKSSIRRYPGYTPSLYAIYDRELTLKFNKNGGTGSIANQTNNQYYNTGNVISYPEFKLPSSGFTSSTYTLVGWNTKNDESGEGYELGANYTYNVEVDNTTTSKTLYAMWSNNDYKILFNKNGGTSGTVSSMSCKTNTDYKLNKNNYKWAGHTFINWNTKADGTGTSYNDEATVRNLASSGTITLYAQWGSTSYKVWYDGNGNTGQTYDSPSNCYNGKCGISRYGNGSSTLENYGNGIIFKYDKNWEYGKEYSLIQNRFTKDEYTFIGWNTNAMGTGNKINGDEGNYEDKESVSNLTSTDNGIVTLYAQWSGNALIAKINAGDGGKIVNANTTYKGINYSWKIGTDNLVYRKKEGETSWNNEFFKINTGVEKDLLNYNNKNYVNLSKTGYHAQDNAEWLCTGCKASSYSQDTKFYASDICSISNGDCRITLTPNWTPNTYTIVFDGNGSTSGSTSSSTCQYGQSCSLNQNGFVKKEYTFTGWNTKADGSGNTYKDKASVKNLSSTDGDTITLYAQWEKNTLTTVLKSGGATSISTSTTYNGTKYNWKIGSSTDIIYRQKDGEETSTSKFFKITADQTKTLPDYNYSNYINLKKTGYYVPEKSEWKCDTGCKKKVYSQTDEYSASNICSINTGDCEVTLEVNWKACAYKIKFNKNGGTGTTMEDMSMTYDTAKTLTNNTYTKTGYIFSGWNTKSDGTGTSYSNGASVNNLTSTCNGTVTLYAKWQPITYKVWYNGNGNTSETYTEKINANEYTGNSKMNSSKTIFQHDRNWEYDKFDNLIQNRFIKTDYKFAGWNSKADGSGIDYEDKESVKNLTSTNNEKITLYAQWIGKGYKINYDGNGATDGSTKATECQFGENCVLNENGFIRTGYTFDKWTTKKDGTGTSYNNNATVKDLAASGSSSVKLYAKWNANTYNITFNPNGADSISTTGKTCKHDTDCTLPTITRTDGNVIGWSENPNCTGQSSCIITGSYRFTSDTTLFAITSKKLTYTFSTNNSNLELSDSTGNVYTSYTNKSCTIYNTEDSCQISSPLIDDKETNENGYFYSTKNNETASYSSSNSNHVYAGTSINISSTKEVYVAYKTLTATFYANDGTDNTKTRSCITPIRSGESCSIVTPSISRSGYTALGYNTKSSYSESDTLIAQNTSININSNKSYYAATRKKVTWSFDTNDSGRTIEKVDGSTGSSSLRNVSCYMYNTDSSCSITTPKISGLTTDDSGFYYSSKMSETAKYSDSTASTKSKAGISKSINSDKTLYLAYGRITVVFKPNNANINGGTSSITETCTFALSKSSCSILSPKITRSGYTAVGWSTNKDATTASWKANTVEKLSSNGNRITTYTYYAITKVKPVATNYKVTLDNNGGWWISDGGATNTRTFTYNDIAYISSFPVPRRNSYRLDGWIVGNTGRVVRSYIDSEENGKTLYANWFYYYEYDPIGGGSSGGGSGSSDTGIKCTCIKPSDCGSLGTCSGGVCFFKDADGNPISYMCE